MKVLVIGASGLVGGALMRTLELAGEEAFGTYRSRKLDSASLQLDVLDAVAVARCVDAVEADVICLAFGAGNIDHCERHPEASRRILVEGAANVMEVAARSGLTVVYYSTDCVFDGESGPYSENDQPAPLSAYGRAKLEAERVVRDATPDHLVLRTAGLFGWDRASSNLAMQVWERLQAGQSMRVANDEWITPTSSDYLAEVSVRLIQSKETGLLHVAGSGRMSSADLAKALARAMALNEELIEPVPGAESDRVALRPRKGGLRSDKLAAVLGTEPPTLGESSKLLRRLWRADTYVGKRPRRATSSAERLKQEILEKVHQYYEVAHRVPDFTPFKSRIQYAGRVFGAEELVNLVDSSLDFWLTMGPYAELFEQKLRRFFGARDALFVTSGSAANLNAVMTLFSPQLDRPLKRGDEVVTPAVTFPTTLAPIVHSGLVPVFVDCEPDTYNVDPSLLEGAISAKTRAIMVPHTLGNPCEMDVICDLAKRHDLYLIEDTCDALGSTFRDRLVGSFGDMATLSFYPAHHITVGEGGAVIVNTPRLSRIARSMRDWGRDCWCAPAESNTCGKRFGWQYGTLPKGYDHKFVYSNIGYNLKATDMQAAVGVAQMVRLPDFVARRKSNFRVLYEGLQPYRDHLLLPRLDSRSDPAWFGFPITVQGGVRRLELVQWLENANIDTRMIFGGNILRQPGYSGIERRVFGGLEGTDRIMCDSFFIGVYPGMTEEMLEFTLDRFRAFFEKRASRARA